MVYIDLLVFLNFVLDFLLILATSIILKRNIKIKKIILASIIGGISSILMLGITDSFILFILKVLVSVVMILISFSFKNIKYFWDNILYFYLSSIILGGFIYLIRMKFGDTSFILNMLMLLIISPMVIYFYVAKVKGSKNNLDSYYNVELYYKNKKYNFRAFLDTGNKLYDQYKKRPIILVYSKKINFNYEKGILVSYNTANGNSILKCLMAEKIIINNKKEVKNVLFGLVNEAFNINDVNMILHNDILGGYND